MKGFSNLCRSTKMEPSRFSLDFAIHGVNYAARLNKVRQAAVPIIKLLITALRWVFSLIGKLFGVVGMEVSI